MPEAPPNAAVPGCKSATQRALVLAALASGASRLRGASEAEDCRELRAALAALGVGFDGETVRGLSGPPALTGQQLDAGLGASTLRFLLALCAAGEGEVRIRAAAALRDRPHGPLLEVLRAQGASIREEDAGWSLRARGYASRAMEVPVAESSQPLSGLMMASGARAQRWSWKGELPSAGYAAMTVGMLRAFRGADAVGVEPQAMVVRPGFGSGRDCALPADASAVLALAAAVCVAGRPLALGRGWSDRHPDADAIRALRLAGLLEVAETDEDGFRLSPGGAVPDAALEFDLDAAPDAGPVLAALGMQLPHGVVLSSPERLRLKESDRVDGILRLATACGAEAVLEGGMLRVGRATAPSGGRAFDPAGDHRLAMAAGIAALRDPRLEIDDSDCVGKSFPSFWDCLALLG